ncbi:Tubulin-specific chaperone A [Gryllus bimaculatus]|nr:Tubulin-specific chaperone A [Gryllus bimaculatus]
MTDPRIKILRIKTGVVKRLAKEKSMYEREADQQRVRIQSYKDQGKDEHEIKKQEEVLRESLMMVPDCQKRLVKAFEELKVLLESESDLADKEEYCTAQKVLEEAKAQLPDSELMQYS